MKYTLKRALALLIAMLLAMPTFAFAEEPVDGTVVLGDVFDEATTIPDLVPEAIELEDAPLEPSDLNLDLSLGELVQEETEQASVVIWRFYVSDKQYATQEAHDGEMILCPDDPAAPGGGRCL